MSWNAFAAWLALEAMDRASCLSPPPHCRMDMSSPLRPGRTRGTCSVGVTVVPLLVDVVAVCLRWLARRSLGHVDCWAQGIQLRVVFLRSFCSCGGRVGVLSWRC
jgi:hypothetical protein